MSKFWFYCIQYKIDSSEKSICDVLTKIDTTLRKRDFQRQNIKYKRKVDCIFTIFTYGSKLDRKIAVSKNTCWDKISSISRIPMFIYFLPYLALFDTSIFPSRIGLIYNKCFWLHLFKTRWIFGHFPTTTDSVKNDEKIVLILFPVKVDFFKTWFKIKLTITLALTF